MSASKRSPRARTVIPHVCSTSGACDSCCNVKTCLILVSGDGFRYVDLQKAYSVILGNMYKTLYNIAARRQSEQEESSLKAVLEKRQRSDVSQDEERLLTRNERDMLARWEKKTDKLTMLEMRVEEAVFVLRDLGGFAVNED